MKATVMGAILALTTTACAATSGMYDRQYAMKTSGHLPCAPDEIKTKRIKGTMGANWIATCNGRTYVCSELQSGMIGFTSSINRQVKCTLKGGRGGRSPSNFVERDQ